MTDSKALQEAFSKGVHWACTLYGKPQALYTAQEAKRLYPDSPIIAESRAIDVQAYHMHKLVGLDELTKAVQEFTAVMKSK